MAFSQNIDFFNFLHSNVLGKESVLVLKYFFKGGIKSNTTDFWEDYLKCFCLVL